MGGGRSASSTIQPIPITGDQERAASDTDPCQHGGMLRCTVVDSDSHQINQAYLPAGGDLDSVYFLKWKIKVPSQQTQSNDRCCGVLANMHVGSLRPVRLGAAEDFAGDGRDLAYPQGEEAQQVHRRVAFSPLEVDVRLPSGVVTQVQQQRCQRIGNGRALNLQHAMALVGDVAFDVEDRREF